VIGGTVIAATREGSAIADLCKPPDHASARPNEVTVSTAVIEREPQAAEAPEEAAS